MNTMQAYPTTPDLFQGKSQTVRDLYQSLVNHLNQLGPFHETMKTIYVSFEHRKPFASALIRNRSIKLILRTDHKITSPRIHSREQITATSFDHTIFLESQRDIDPELMTWLGEAYQASE